MVLFASCLKINELSHDGGVISYVHITIPQNVNIWGLPLRFDIIYYLSYVACLLEQVPISFVVVVWLLCVQVCLVWFYLICISIYYLRNHLFHLILTMALPVGSNSWNYQQTFYKIWCFISYLLPYACLLWSWSWTSFLYTTEKHLHIRLVHDKWYS